jgi:hypothetical protein
VLLPEMTVGVKKGWLPIANLPRLQGGDGLDQDLVADPKHRSAADF